MTIDNGRRHPAPGGPAPPCGRVAGAAREGAGLPVVAPGLVGPGLVGPGLVRPGLVVQLLVAPGLGLALLAGSAAMAPAGAEFPAAVTEEAVAARDLADREGTTRQEAEFSVEAGRESGALSFVFENDLFYDADRHYTNGVRLSWISGPATTPRAALDAARLFPLFPEDGRVRTSYSIGQSMFTASDIDDADPPLTERPYAGWLYGSIGLISETGNQLDQLDLTLGIVGPASLAEQSQKLAHELTGSGRPQGWGTQLRNEPGVILAYQRSWRQWHAESIGGFGFDITPYAGGALGNVYTYASAGVMLRLGDQLPLDYGPPRIRPGPGGSNFFIPRRGFGWYVFGGVEGRAIARNIFLDGNTFRSSRSVSKEPFVGDLQFGIALTWQNARLAYTHVVRTREFKTQDERDDFGAISLSIRF